MSIYMVDIDGTICDKSTDQTYEQSVPFKDRIAHFNNLFDQGHEIHYWTARGMSNGNLEAKKELTYNKLRHWGVKYTSVNFEKPHYDRWIDDKAQNVESYFDEIELDKEWK